MSDWFKLLFGFKESSYEEVQRLIQVDDNVMTSTINGRSFQVGKLENLSVQELRRRAHGVGKKGATKVYHLATDDVFEVKNSLF
jgi:hypothetical protein